MGNTTLRRFGSDESRLVSRDGVVGSRLPSSTRTQRLALADGDLLLLHTDGVRERFSQDDYPQILGHGAVAVCANVVRRFGKDHDDAACVAVRYRT